jgi:hypothetical protein
LGKYFEFEIYKVLGEKSTSTHVQHGIEIVSIEIEKDIR